MVVSLFFFFFEILFPEPLKLSRNHPEVFKLKIEVARKVYCENKSTNLKKKSLAQEVRQKSDISEHRSKGWG